VFLKNKGLLRRAEVYIRETLIEAMGWALEEVPARDAQDFFGHCDYSLRVNCCDRRFRYNPIF